MNMKQVLAALMAAGLLLTTTPVLAEEASVEAAPEAVEATAPAAEEAAPAAEESAPVADVAAAAAIADTQKLDASYTLALNAINAEDYATAKEYLNVCFAYCDPQTNPTMYADLLLKQACIDVIEEKNDMALLLLDAAIRVQPDLADAYLVRTQVYAAQGGVDQAIENLEKYIELTEDTTLYETVAQLQEANGNLDAAQEAYDKYVAGAGSEVQEAGFQSGLYRMEAGKFEEAIKAFEAYADDETYAAGAQYNIGICKMNMGDNAGAIEAFTACLGKGGNFDGLYYNRGVCNLLSANWDAAANDFSTSFHTESYKDDAHYNLAICRMQQENYESAIELFTELIGDGKTVTAATASSETAAGAAEATEATVEQPATAETATEETAAVETAATEAEDQGTRVVNDGAYYYRAVCFAAIGNLDDAIADYTTCIDHGYELAQSYYQRAQVYAAKGDTENQNSDLANSLKYAE